ncbi:MAG: SEC61-beta family protein [Candidatus Woesearchaeota archaeon]
MAEKIQMPTSTAGLTRYFDDYSSKFEIKPGHVVLLAVVITALVIILHIWMRGVAV